MSIKSIANVADRNAIENEMPWSERDVPTTLFQMLSGTAAKFPKSDAVTFQLLSGPTDKAETLSWGELLETSVRVANLFRSLGIGV